MVAVEFSPDPATSNLFATVGKNQVRERRWWRRSMDESSLSLDRCLDENVEDVAGRWSSTSSLSKEKNAPCSFSLLWAHASSSLLAGGL